MKDGREAVAWSTMAAILVIARLCEPSSELHIAEDWYRRTALEDLLGVAAEQVNDDRLYRALDQLLPHKTAIEQHLRQRLGELFAYPPRRHADGPAGPRLPRLFSGQPRRAKPPETR